MRGNVKHDLFPLSRPVEGSAGRTGSWRVFLPVVDKEKCNGCGICSLYCPDAVISRDLTIDLAYCKGCGICAFECPKKAVTMIREEK